MSTNSKNNATDNKAGKKIDPEIIREAIEDLNENIDAHPQRQPIPFNRFLQLVAENPHGIIRTIFQVFHDMIDGYVGEGFEEYPDDPGSHWICILRLLSAPGRRYGPALFRGPVICQPAGKTGKSHA